MDALLKLAQEKFERLIEEKDRLAEQGVRVNVIGNLSLLPKELQLLVEKATSLTRKNQRYVHIFLVKKKYRSYKVLELLKYHL